MHLNRFHDLVADGVAGVQAGHGILENHRHFRAHQLAALFFGDAFQVALVELQLLRHHFAGKVDQAHNRQRTDRFARAGLADDPHDLPLLNLIADAVDRAERCLIVAKMHR